MKLDKNRILRTLIQSAAGAGIALITTLSANFSKEALITGAIQLVSTVLIAVLMNIKKQTEEDCPPEDME